MLWILFSILCLLAAAGIVFLLYLQRQRDKRIVMRRLYARIDTGDDDSGNGRALLYSGLGQLKWSLDPEIPKLLDQLGWRSVERRALFYAIQIAVPILALLLATLVDLFRHNTGLSLLLPVFALGIGYLLPKRWLRGAVVKRRERLVDEVSTMLPLLRMLFEVGMTAEQSLRALMQEGDKILPELSLELRRVFNRVDAGLDLTEELRFMMQRLDIDEVTDCVVILEQLIRQGGGAVSSLVALKELYDDRRMSNLQEKVSKLSAKMSGVMVAFLFPALLIILAGPGFIAIFSALSGMGK